MYEHCRLEIPESSAGHFAQTIPSAQGITVHALS